MHNEIDFNINKDLNNKSKEKELTNKDRDQFKSMFEEYLDINDLIEEALEESSTSKASNSINTEENSPAVGTSSLDMERSYQNLTRIQQERLQRIGILKSDPTGKQIKAAGEDL